MKCLKIGDIDIGPLIIDLDQYSNLWGNFPERSNYEGSSHEHTDCLVFRSNSSGDPRDFQNETSSKWIAYPRNIICLAEALKNNFNTSDIGRVMATALFPRKEIPSHIDEGIYSQSTLRFHIPLITTEHTVFTVGGEEFFLKEGCIYLINHLVEHSVKNMSDDERIHLIIDLVR